MKDSNANDIRKKIAELETIYDNFISKLGELRSERNVVINGIVKRIDEQKIKDILNNLHKKA